MLGSLHPAGLAQLVVADIFGSHRARLLGPERQHRAAGRAHRRQLQLSLRRRGAGHPAALVRHRRRRRVPPRPHADRRDRRAGADLCARPLHAGVRMGVRLGAGREPLPPAGGRQLRLRRDAGADLRRAARRLHPRGRAARTAAGERRRGARGPRGGACRRRLLRPHRPFRRCADGRVDERADRRGGDPDAGARARRAHAQRRRRRGDGDRGRRTGLVERRVPAQCRAAPRLCRAGAAVRHRRRGARSGRALRRRAPQQWRASARRGHGARRSLAERRDGALARSGQRLQSAAHRHL